MKLVHAAVVLTALGASAMTAGAAPTIDTVDATISTVTVYPDRAKIQRSAEVKLDAGEHSLLFVNLPLDAEESSFRASASGIPGITLQGLSYRIDVHRETVHEDAADLERRIRRFQRDSLAVLNDRLGVLKKQQALLDAMTKARAESDASKAGIGEIDVARWERAYGFLGEKMTAVTDSIRLTNNAVDEVNESIKLLKARLSQRSSQTETRTMAVQVNLKLEKAGKTAITLDYLIGNASWRPLYDARLNESGDTVELAMYAEIAQRTGEDWKDVQLELSTVRPSNETGPGQLTPWQLSILGSNPGVYTGTTGRISGTVVDRRTGEPVAGASVSIPSVQKGAMTNFAGTYQIDGLRPGAYTVQIKGQNYEPIEMAGITIAAGKTREQPISLSQRRSDFDRTIKVVGRQDQLQVFETANQTTITKENITQRPVTTVDDLLNQVAGVVTNPRGEVIVRGSRAGEVSYMTDGVPISDPLGGLGQGGAQMQMVRGSIDYASVLSGEVATTFTVARKENVPSDGTAIRAYIARWQRPVDMKLIARPRLRTGVFREATMLNQTQTPLLAGEVSVFDGSSYLGKTRLVRVYVPGEKIVLPFGASDDLTVERKIVKRKHEIDGDKVKQRETIEIVLTNKSKDVHMVELAEPFPRSTDDRIKVKMRDVKPEPDKLDDLGTATWQVTLTAGESRTVTFTYDFEFPRGVRISGF